MAENNIILEEISGVRPYRASVNKREVFKGGGDDDKVRIQATMKSRFTPGKSKEIKLVGRFDFADRYKNTWKLFHDAGLPVVSSLRESNGFVYMLDLTADGSCLYGKATKVELQRAEKRKDKPRDPKPLDRIFVFLIEKDLDSIRSRAKQYATLATQKGLRIPYDDPFELLIHPDGSWNLICLDLEKGGLPLDREFIEGMGSLLRKSVDPIDSANEINANMFIENLKVVNSYLTGQNSTED